MAGSMLDVLPWVLLEPSQQAHTYAGSACLTDEKMEKMEVQGA